MVYWLSFLRPASPSFINAANCGMIGWSNWMMMEAVMYGYTPIAMTEKFCRAPPESMFSMPSSAFDSKTCCRATRLTPGTGTCAINR